MTPPDRVRVRAHAKLNLFLRVLAREASGFHGIETIFTLLELADEITATRTARGIDLEVEGADCGPVEQNLAVRAARLVLDSTGNRFGVRLELKKNIPVQGGLGGGSSDGAAALWAVNALAGNVVPGHEILQLASRLGSDVPFFASRAPLALGWARGERMFRLAPPPPAPVLLVVPGFGIATADAYRLIDAALPGAHNRGAVILDGEVLSTWSGMARVGGNDFESVVFARHPQLRELFGQLAETGPLLIRLAGSGSAVAAIYRNAADRDAAGTTIAGRSGLLVLSTQTRFESPSNPASLPRTD